jgi:hypothetical protein
VTGLDPVLAGHAAMVGPEQPPLEERVADVDQQLEILLAGGRHRVAHGSGRESYIGSSGKIGRVSLRYG